MDQKDGIWIRRRWEGFQRGSSPLRNQIRCLLVFSFLLFSLSQLSGQDATNSVAAFKNFTTNAPYLKSLKFWVHNTPARMGDASRSNFFQLYDCVSGTNSFLIKYYQRPNGLRIEFDQPDYIHLKQGPLYYGLGPNPQVSIWYNQTNADDLHNTLRGSLDNDDRLLRWIFFWGITQDRVTEFRWDGERFKVTTDQSTIDGQLFVTNGAPDHVLIRSKTIATAQVDDYRIDYSWPTGGVTSVLPIGFTRSRDVFKKWVPWTLVGILEMETTESTPDLSQIGVSNLVAAEYGFTGELQKLEYTNNSLRIFDSKMGFRSYNLRDPGAKPALLAKLFSNRWATIVLFAIIALVPALFLLRQSGRNNERPNQLDVEEEKNKKEA